jgi:hypothetical protein
MKRRPKTKIDRGQTDRPLDRTLASPLSRTIRGLHLRPFERCFMNADPKVADVDETPEYPLPSPTDSLSRDQRPPDDEDDAGGEQVAEDDGAESQVKECLDP